MQGIKREGLCPDLVSLAFMHGLIFFISSAYAKVNEILILYFDNALISNSNIFQMVYETLFQDMIVSLSIFILLSIFLRILHNPPMLKKPLYILQFGYLVFVLAYIQYFRSFRTQLNISLFNAFSELITMPESSVNEAWVMSDLFSAIFPLLSYILIMGVIWPVVFKIDIRGSSFKKVCLSLSALVLILCLSQVVDPFAFDDKVTRRYSTDINPLYFLYLSAHYSVDIVEPIAEEDVPEYIFGDLEGLRIDDEYPLMHGSEYAICSNDRLSKSAGFKQLCERDDDGDGYAKTVDCKDSDPLIHPGAKEIRFNGIDENCDISDDPAMNLVFIVLESMKAEDFQIYGYPVENTPNLMRYENMSMRWENFYSNVISSYRAELMMYCSVYPFESSYNLDHPNYFHTPCMGEILKAKGYRTSYIAPFIIQRGGLNEFIKFKGWDTQIERWDINTKGFEIHPRGVEEKAIIKPFFKWVEEDKEKPFFSVLRLQTGHNPIQVTKEYELFERKKDNAIYYVDSFIGDIIKGLKEEGLMERTLVVIIGDHMLERTMDKPGKIPFIILNPSLFKSMEKDDITASLIDVSPTLLGLMGIESINPFIGENLFTTGDRDRQVYFFHTDGNLGLLKGREYFYHEAYTKRNHLSIDGVEVMDASAKKMKEYYKDALSTQNGFNQLYQTDRLFIAEYMPKQRDSVD